MRCKLLTILLLAGYTASAQQYYFKVIPLGVKGGEDESNLSAYLLAPASSDDYVCLDAGTLYSGIKKAVGEHLFSVKDSVLKNHIKGYLISHGHLDHVAGLIINSPEDGSKNIYALPEVIDVLKTSYFTWKSWANFANEGDRPFLNKYHYTTLSENTQTPLDATRMSVQAFRLSHGNPYTSTAFLVSYQDRQVLYLGDTGADQIEKSDKLSIVWKAAGELIRNGSLKAIFIETSFPDEQPENLLFGHLTPRLLMTELGVLDTYAGAGMLKNFPVVITHIKPQGKNEQLIRAELKKGNTVGVKLIFAEQGTMLRF